MDIRPVFAAQFLLNLTTLTIVMRWFVFPVLKELDIHRALLPLALTHCVRTLGMFAVMPGITGPRVAATEWALHVAIGDAVTVVIALLTAVALRHRSRVAIPLAWILNVVGGADIVNAGVNAARERILVDAGPQLFVVAFGVPMIIVTHITMIVLLVRHATSKGRD